MLLRIPAIKEKMTIDNDISQLRVFKTNFDIQKFKNQDLVNIQIPKNIATITSGMKKLKADIETKDNHELEVFEMKLEGKVYNEKEPAGEMLKVILKNTNTDITQKKIGEYRGFDIVADLENYAFTKEKKLAVRGKQIHSVELGDSAIGNIQRIENVLKSFDEKYSTLLHNLENEKANLVQAKLELEKPFDKAAELEIKLKRQAELNAELEIGKNEIEVDSSEFDSDVSLSKAEEINQQFEEEAECDYSEFEQENEEVEKVDEEIPVFIEVEKRGLMSKLESIKSSNRLPIESTGISSNINAEI